MVESKAKIGLLSTSQDAGLVRETMTEMGLAIPNTEVIALITAGNAKGRANNEFADRAIKALGEAGITQIREVDIAEMPPEQVAEKLLAPTVTEGREPLLVITGGEKGYLQDHLVATGAQELLKAQMTAGTLPVLTISAGTSVMGQHLSVASKKKSNVLHGMGIVPATFLVHFDDREEARLWNSLLNRETVSHDTIVGIGNEQALVGRSVDRFRVVGPGEVTVFYPEPQSVLHQTTTGSHRMHHKNSNDGIILSKSPTYS